MTIDWALFKPHPVRMLHYVCLFKPLVKSPIESYHIGGKDLARAKAAEWLAPYAIKLDNTTHEDVAEALKNAPFVVIFRQVTEGNPCRQVWAIIHPTVEMRVPFSPPDEQYELALWNEREVAKLLRNKAKC